MGTWVKGGHGGAEGTSLCERRHPRAVRVASAVRRLSRLRKVDARDVVIGKPYD